MLNRKSSNYFRWVIVNKHIETFYISSIKYTCTYLKFRCFCKSGGSEPVCDGFLIENVHRWNYGLLRAH